LGALGPAVSVCALAPARFLSAKRSFQRRTWRPHTDTNAVVAHANWIDGHDAKKAAMRAHGAWLVNASAALDPSMIQAAPIR